jgi:ribosome biogenesis GTPase
MNTNDKHSIHTGVVYRKTAGGYTVHEDGRIVECALSAKLRFQSDNDGQGSPKKGFPKSQHKQRADPVVVGDVVEYIDSGDGAGLIVAALPRRNQLSRRSAVPMPSARPYEQVIVANVDQIAPVFAAENPRPKWHLLDRYLVSAEAAGLPAIICITKIDLVQDREGALERTLLETLEVYQAIGYPVLLTSAYTGAGLTEILEALRGRRTALLGKSGVGKTSLLNALQPDLGLKVRAVSDVTGKGVHTTSHLEMFPLEFGGAVIDTPGIREFGLWDVDPGDLPLYFPEMRPFLDECKFGLDCWHDQEPGCAVREAVTAGRISPYRYRSYMRLLEETG